MTNKHFCNRNPINISTRPSKHFHPKNVLHLTIISSCIFQFWLPWGQKNCGVGSCCKIAPQVVAIEVLGHLIEFFKWNLLFHFFSKSTLSYLQSLLISLFLHFIFFWKFSWELGLCKYCGVYTIPSQRIPSLECTCMCPVETFHNVRLHLLDVQFGLIALIIWRKWDKWTLMSTWRSPYCRFNWKINLGTKRFFRGLNI